MLNGVGIPIHGQKCHSDIEEVPFISWYVVIAPVNSLSFTVVNNCKFSPRIRQKCA